MKKPKYHNTDKGMNWWNFHIEKMNAVERYLFIGLILVIPTMFGFFAGLAVDFMMLQEAQIAYWGMGLGAIFALAAAGYQLRKLVK